MSAPPVINRAELPLNPKLVTAPAWPAKLFATAPVQRWLVLWEAAGVPAGPILGVDGALAHPQLRARDMLVEMEHPRAGHVTLLGTPIHFSETPAGPTAPPPTLGQHTEVVLADLGFNAEDIAALRASGAI